MQFTNIIAAAVIGFAATAFADTVTFKNLDSTPKTIYFTGQLNMAGAPATLELAANAVFTQTFTNNWNGNFYSVSSGSPATPGMLGEVNFSAGTVWYDVSAIINPNDLTGVKQLYTDAATDPVSGCDSYAERCSAVYMAPDDVQTKSTSLRDLICTVGNAAAPVAARTARDIAHGHKARAHTRDFTATKSAA